MKSLITTTLLLLLCSTCHKNREDAPLPPAEQLSGTVLDTLTGEPIPGCRVYLLETKSGFQHIVAETQTDSSGRFLLHVPGPVPHALLQVTHNGYAWKTPVPVQPEQTVWLKPYVLIHLEIIQLQPCELQLSGNFNESGQKLPALYFNKVTVTSAVYDTLIVRVTATGGVFAIKKQWIHTMNQKVDIP